MYGEQLRYFALAYQLKSFSSAAKRVPMSPQGLTKSIRSLETELGVPLFETDSNGKLEPTQYADELIKFAHDYEVSMVRLTAAFDSVRKRESHEVHVGIGLGILGYLGPNFLERFNALHPSITLKYDETNDRMCDEGLRSGTYDLVLCVSPFDHDFLAETLYSTPMCFWVSSNDDLAQKESLRIEDFDGRGLAIPGEEFKCYDHIRAKAAEANVSFSEVFTSAEIFRLFEYAREGKGLGFSAQHLVDMPLFKNDPGVKGLPLADSYWGFGIARLASTPLGPDAQAFYDYCLDYCLT